MEVNARCIGCTRPLTLSSDPEDPTPRTCGRAGCRKVAERRAEELAALEARLVQRAAELEAGGRHRLREG